MVTKSTGTDGRLDRGAELFLRLEDKYGIEEKRAVGHRGLDCRDKKKHASSYHFYSSLRYLSRYFLRSPICAFFPFPA